MGILYVGVGLLFAEQLFALERRDEQDRTADDECENLHETAQNRQIEEYQFCYCH